MAARQSAAARAADTTPPKDGVALVLQGGGALGAYHVGAYQALHDAGLEPDWIAGISIGAINACILAGNDPADRLDRLDQLWHDISRPGDFARWLPDPWRWAANQFSYLEALTFGQPHFWTPRVPSPLFVPALAPEQASWCDPTPMHATLLRLASFDRINRGATRLSLGATRLTSGELVFFDNRRDTLGPEHVLASGSLPPGFPATRVGADLYWDGGCVSNTPLDALYADPPRGHTQVFVIDLWDAHGPAPTTMDGVAWRAKQIRYASRTTQHIEQVAAAHNHRWALHQLMRQGVDVAAVCAGVDLGGCAGDATFEFVHVIYHPAADEIADADAEFSRSSIAERRAAGLADMRQALAAAPARAPGARPRQGATVRRVRSAPRPG